MAKDPRARQAALAALAVAAAWSVWLPVFLRHRAQFQAATWLPPLSFSAVAEGCYRMFFEPAETYVPALSAWAAAGLCAACLLALLWRAGPAEWFFIAGTAGPLAISLAVSAWDTSVFHYRYFLFAHLFLLGAAARAVWNFSGTQQRGGAAALLLAAMASIAFGEWQGRATAEASVKAAVQFVETQRMPDEPVVAHSPLVFLPALYHAHDRGGYRLLWGREPLPHYLGAAVFTRDELILPEQFARLPGRRVWVLSMSDAFGSAPLPIPATWTLVQQKRFPDRYRLRSEIRVLEYATGSDQAMPGGKKRGKDRHPQSAQG